MSAVGFRFLRRWSDLEYSADFFDQMPSPFAPWLGYPVDRQAHTAAAFGGDVRNGQWGCAWVGVEAELNAPGGRHRTAPLAGLVHPKSVEQRDDLFDLRGGGDVRRQPSQDCRPFGLEPLEALAACLVTADLEQVRARGDPLGGGAGDDPYDLGIHPQRR